MRYAPTIVAIAPTMPMTIPAISPPVGLDELLDPVSGVLAAPTVVVECCVTTVLAGGNVEVTRAAERQSRSHQTAIRKGRGAEP